MNYVQTLLDQIRTLGLSQQVRMVGDVRGEVKQNLFEHTDTVIVPSYTENFGMVVAEALAHAVPVIASTGTPWSRLEEMGSGLWVNNDPESLAKAIEHMSKMPLSEMGRRGREWMRKEFTWESRAREMMEAYKKLVHKTENLT
jgi:glycosyltransferase involved in cell wall biosynthesis